MRPSIQKALGWIGLAIGGGGTLLLVWALIIIGKSSPEVWPWLTGTTFVSVACSWMLRRAYRLEPVPGKIQLALVDLIAALTLLASVLYIGSYALEGVELLHYWLVPALVISLSYLAGVTRAARSGLRGGVRYLAGVSTGLTIIGCLGAGALILHLTVCTVHESVNVCRELVLNILGSDPHTFSNWMIYNYRVSLCALPLGLLLGLLSWLLIRNRQTTVAEGSPPA